MTDRKRNDTADLWIVRLYLCRFVTGVSRSPDLRWRLPMGSRVYAVAGKSWIAMQVCRSEYFAFGVAARIRSRTLTSAGPCGDPGVAKLPVRLGSRIAECDAVRRGSTYWCDEIAPRFSRSS
jgi:hypothetical protein